jgi:hypothetical protein
MDDKSLEVNHASVRLAGERDLSTNETENVNVGILVYRCGFYGLRTGEF